MAFLNGIFLWGLLAAALPILLHLFYRRRKSRVPFSTLQFFRPQERLLAHRRRLREWLLLCLRCLALALLALALARPSFQAAHRFNTRTDLVIVLDDTLSMDRRTAAGQRAFELARQKAAELLDSLHEGDGAALVFVSGRPGMALIRNPQKVQAFLRESVPTAATGSFGSALQQAARQLETGASPNREIYLLTDCQSNQLPAAPVGLDLARLRLYLLPIAGTAENAAVAPVRLSAKPAVVNQPLWIPFTLHNFGDRERGLEVRLEIRGQPVKSQYLILPPQSERNGSFEYIPATAGFLPGCIAIADPDLDLDNRSWFGTDVAERLRVLLLRTDPQSRADPWVFLRPALDPPGGAGLNGFQLDDLYVQELAPGLLRPYAVVALADPDPLPEPAGALLRQYLRGGGSLLVFAGGKVGADTFASLGEPLLGGLYGRKLDSSAAGLAWDGPMRELNELLEMDLLRWRRWQELRLPEGARTLARVGAAPAVGELRLGDGRFLATAFSPRRDYSNWPELKSYPIAMLHLFDYAAAAPRRNLPLECGKTLRLKALAPAVTRQDGSGQARALVRRDGEAVLDDAWLPGLVKIAGGDVQTAIAYAAPGESDPAVLAPNAAAARLCTPAPRVLDPQGEVLAQVRQYRQGGDLAGLLLLTVLALLVGESLVACGQVLFGGPARPAPSH